MTFGQRGCSRPVTGAALGVWRGAWIARPLPFMSIRRAGLRPAISGSGLELDILRDLAATVGVSPRLWAARTSLAWNRRPHTDLIF
jgi:hypothetical protein